MFDLKLRELLAALEEPIVLAISGLKRLYCYALDLGLILFVGRCNDESALNLVSTIFTNLTINNKI